MVISVFDLNNREHLFLRVFRLRVKKLFIFEWYLHWLLKFLHRNLVEIFLGLEQLVKFSVILIVCINFFGRLCNEIIAGRTKFRVVFLDSLLVVVWILLGNHLLFLEFVFKFFVFGDSVTVVIKVVLNFNFFRSSEEFRDIFVCLCDPVIIWSQVFVGNLLGADVLSGVKILIVVQVKLLNDQILWELLLLQGMYGQPSKLVRICWYLDKLLLMSIKDADVNVLITHHAEL